MDTLNVLGGVLGILVGFAGLLGVALGVTNRTRVDTLEKTVTDQRNYIGVLEGAQSRDAEVITKQRVELEAMAARVEILESLQPGKETVEMVRETLTLMRQMLESLAASNGEHARAAEQHWRMELTQLSDIAGTQHEIRDRKADQ